GRFKWVSGAEFSLAPQNAERRHRVSWRFLLQLEACPDLEARVAGGSLGSEKTPPIWVAQFIVESPPDDAPFEYETDRVRVIGRNRSWQNPMMSIDGTDGCVLDPMFAIRRRFSLDPRQQKQITFITVAAESHDDLMRLIAKYRDR